MAVLLGTILLTTFLAWSKAEFALTAPHEVNGTWRDSVTLPCSYHAPDHTQEKTDWLFNSQRVFYRDDTDDHVIVTRYRDRLSLPQDHQGSNVSLTIANLQIDDGGMYTCRVSLRRPGANSLITQEAIIHLNVRKVAVTTPLTRPEGSLFKVSEGGMMRFTCFAEGSPPITYRWYKHGTEGASDIFQTLGSSFIIESAQTSHSGSYYCVVENKILQKISQKSQVFQLIVTGDSGRRTPHSTDTPKRMTRTIETDVTKRRAIWTTEMPGGNAFAPSVSSGSTLPLIILVVVLSLALLVILAAVLVTRRKRRKGTDGIYQIPTMSELNARATQDFPIVNVCQVNICPINGLENNSCLTSGMPGLRKQNEYQPDQKPNSDCQGPYSNCENEYEQLLTER